MIKNNYFSEVGKMVESNNTSAIQTKKLLKNYEDDKKEACPPPPHLFKAFRRHKC
jgi:hypothetical protein